MINDEKKNQFNDGKNGNDENVKSSKKKTKIPWIIIFLLGLGCFLFMYSYNKKTSITDFPAELTFATEQAWDGKMMNDLPQASTEMIEIPGYSNLTISKEFPEVRLVNPEGNTVYLQYTISENGEEKYSSDAIKPGNMVKANFMDIFTEGEHEITITINTYDIETQRACNGTSQNIQVTVKS